MQQKWVGYGHEPVMHNRALFLGTHFVLLKTQSGFFYLPWNDWIHIIKHRGGEVFRIFCRVCSTSVQCTNVLRYLLSHRKKLHYNLVAAAMQYVPIPSPCSMNMKYIMKHNNINRWYWELPIHQCPTRQYLGCSLEQILQRWIQTDVAQFSIKWSNYSRSH